MAYYDLPSGNETQGFYEIFTYIGNTATEGLFFPSMLLVVWIVAFVGTKQYSSSRAFTFSSFFCSILAMMLGVLNLINPRYMYLCFVLTLIGFVWLKLDTQ